MKMRKQTSLAGMGILGLLVGACSFSASTSGEAKTSSSASNEWKSGGNSSTKLQLGGKASAKTKGSTETKNSHASANKAKFGFSLKGTAEARVRTEKARKEAVHGQVEARTKLSEAAKLRAKAKKSQAKARLSLAEAKKTRAKALVSFEGKGKAAFKTELRGSLDKARATAKLAKNAETEAKQAAELQAQATAEAQAAEELARKAEAEARAALERAEAQVEICKSHSEKAQANAKTQAEAAEKALRRARAGAKAAARISLQAKASAQLAEADAKAAEKDSKNAQEFVDAVESELDETNKGNMDAASVAATAKRAESEADEADKAAKQTQEEVQKVEEEKLASEKGVEQARQEEDEIQRGIAEVEKETEVAERVEKDEPPTDALKDSSEFATVGGCQTAFAEGEKTFVDLGLTKSRWGWQVGPLDEGRHQAELYAAAGRNDTTKGTKVGMLRVEVAKQQVSVTYDLRAKNKLTETHLYVGSEQASTISPGKLGHQHQLDGATSDTFTIKASGPVYIIAHAVVCGD